MGIPLLLCMEGTHTQKRSEIAAWVHPAPGHGEKTDGQQEEWKMPVAERNDLTAVWQSDGCTRQEGNIRLEHDVERPGLPVAQSPLRRALLAAGCFYLHRSTHRKQASRQS